MAKGPKDLLAFGYAPGNYTFRCRDCSGESLGDKRSLRCRECAVQAMNSSQQSEIVSSNERVEHELKVASEFFDAVESGQKPFEIRKGDRPFKIGDTLWLREVDLVLAYTGREVRKRITFVLRGWGMESGYVALGLTPSPVETSDGIETVAHPTTKQVANETRHQR